MVRNSNIPSDFIHQGSPGTILFANFKKLNSISISCIRLRIRLYFFVHGLENGIYLLQNELCMLATRLIWIFLRKLCTLYQRPRSLRKFESQWKRDVGEISDKPKQFGIESQNTATAIPEIRHILPKSRWLKSQFCEDLFKKIKLCTLNVFIRPDFQGKLLRPSGH